jgi:hypothetical protein
MRNRLLRSIARLSFKRHRIHLEPGSWTKVSSRTGRLAIMGEPIGGKTATHQAQYCAAPRFFVGTRQVQRPIIGGLGDLWGTLVGGVILAVAQTLGARINPGYQILAGHIVFLTILALRPQGFFQKTR